MTKAHDKTCRTRDSSPDICGAQSAAVSRLFILPRRAPSLRVVIYSRSPQNHPDSSSSSYIPSDPSPPFQLAAGRGREKRCRDRTEEGWWRRGWGGTSFLIWQEAASVSSCEVAVQLIPAAETLLLQLSVRRRDAATAGQRAQWRGQPSSGCRPRGAFQTSSREERRL